VPELRTRLATPQDEGFLREMLYLALFVPPGEPPSPRSIVDTPALQHYVHAFGHDGRHDHGIIAETPDGQAIGAAWVRLLPRDDAGYGFVADDTPELSIAVAQMHRGKGVGTALLTELLDVIGPRFPAVSLSVDAANPARRLYERFGFEPVTPAADESSITMVRRLTGP
jgi:GNAT superfamily N-acetyltransferase